MVVMCQAFLHHVVGIYRRKEEGPKKQMIKSSFLSFPALTHPFNKKLLN